MNREEAITILKEERWYMSRYSEEYKEAYDMAIEALNHSVFPNSSDLISRQDAIDAVTGAIWHYPNECYKNLNVYEVAEALVSDEIKSLPSRITEYTTFCGVPIEKAARIVQEHKADPLCALADRECPFQGKEFAWCLTCPHISEEDRELVRKAVEGSEPKTGECKTCKRSSDYRLSIGENDTRCPIEEHYALPKDGYCHLYEPYREDGE